MTYSIRLNDAYKGFTLDQDKLFSPQETVQRLKDRLKTIDLDVLRQVNRIDNGRLGIPVFFSVCGNDALEAIGTKKQMGKGATPEQAEASAVMELVERFSFFSFYKTPSHFVTQTYANLSGPKIPFEHIAQSVHDDSDDLEISRGIFETLPLKWTWAYNLTTQEPVQVPFDWFFMINEFNGPSAGNCAEEALSQGICEIVERHVSSIISHQQLKPPAIRPESATDAMVLDMLQKYEKIGVKLFVSDFTLDTGIPSVGVLAYDPGTFPQTSEIVWTAGTTPCPQKAFSRALSEVAQLAGDFNTSANYVASGLPKFTTLEEAGYVTSPGKRVDIHALPDLSDNNIKKEVENCIRALSRRGMQVYAIDTMHPKLEIPAFYTIIPRCPFQGTRPGHQCGHVQRQNHCRKPIAPLGPGRTQGHGGQAAREILCSVLHGKLPSGHGLPGHCFTLFFKGAQFEPQPPGHSQHLFIHGGMLKGPRAIPGSALGSRKRRGP